MAARAEPAQRQAGAAWANFHVTLLFLGDVDTAQVPAICAAVDQLALPAMAPRLLLDRLQVWQRAGALVLEAQQVPPALLQLVYGLQQALLPLGLEAATREYRPHLTLSRITAGSRPRPVARRSFTSPRDTSRFTSRARGLTGHWRSGRWRTDSPGENALSRMRTCRGCSDRVITPACFGKAIHPRAAFELALVLAAELRGALIAHPVRSLCHAQAFANQHLLRLE